MDPFQYGESALVEPNGFRRAPATQLQQLCRDALASFRVANLLNGCQPVNKRLDHTLIAEQLQSANRVFAGDGKRSDEPMRLTAGSQGEHFFKPKHAGIFRHHDCSRCRNFPTEKPSETPVFPAFWRVSNSCILESRISGRFYIPFLPLPGSFSYSITPSSGITFSVISQFGKSHVGTT